MALEELHDVGVWLDRQVLSGSAVRWLQHDLQKQLGQDIAFGTQELRRQLTLCVKSDLTIRSEGRRRLRHIIDLARPGYLDRWAAEAARIEPPRAERIARAAAAHLLDSGHSLTGLHRWLTQRSTLSAADLLTEAASLAATSPKAFSIWVPVISLPKPERLADPLPNFVRLSDLDPETADQLQQSNTKPLIGAFGYDIDARDAERAVEVVIEVVERMRARARFAGVAGQVVVAREAYVATERRSIELRTPDRGALIMSLVSEGQLFAVDPGQTSAAQRHAIDDALELAAPLNKGALAPGISGSWAALEALLTDAQDSDEEEGKVAAAVRAAKLTACSWPRAELTALSYQVDERNATGKALAINLGEVATNRDRSEIVARQLRRDKGLPLRRSWRFQSDVAAVARMNDLLADPAKGLKQAGSYIEASLRRMYRCRNVIVHGGSTRGDVLVSTLRVVAPLVGATLDRLTHAHLVLGIEPLQLATRADVAISMASDQEMGFDVVDLLGGA